MVIAKKQNSLFTIEIFSILGFLVSIFCEITVPESIALFVCIEAVMMSIIFPGLLTIIMPNKQIKAMNRSIDDKKIKKMYKEIAYVLSDAHINPLFINAEKGFAFTYSCDINKPCESGSSLRYKIELDENDNNYKCTIVSAQYENIPTNQTLEQYNAKINRIFYNELQGAVFSINNETDNPFIELIRIITIKDTSAAAIEIVSSIKDMMEVSEKRYSRSV